MKKLILPLVIAIFLVASWSGAEAQIYSDADTMAIIDAYGNPGDTVGVILHMANHTIDVAGYLHRIVYDDVLLEALSVECLDRGCQLETYSGNFDTPGVVSILAYDMFDYDYIPIGSGPVMQINFEVKPTAPPGTITILRFEDVIPPQNNNWSDTSGEIMLVPQLLAGNFSILGGGINQPPVINFIGNQEVAEGQLLQFSVTAHDPDADPITLTAVDLPDNASFPVVQGDSLVTGTFSFRPDFEQGPDTFVVTFRATDNSNNVTNRPVQVVVLDQPNDFLSISTDQGGIPGATARPVDIILFNSIPVYGVQFEILYDPVQIHIPEVYSAERAYDMWFSYNEPDPGRIIVIIFSVGLDSISSGGGPLAQLIVDANPFAAYGPTELILENAIESIDSTGMSKPLITEDGFFTIDQYGDSNLDGVVNVGDCITVVAYLIGRGTLSERQHDAADVDSTGRVDIGDLQQLINIILEIGIPPLSYPQDLPVIVELLKEDIGREGDRLSVPLWADVTGEASAVQFELTFDTDKLGEIEIVKGDMVSDMALDYTVAGGSIKGVVYHLGGNSFGPATGRLVEFKFDALSGDFDPSSDINLTDFLVVNPAADFMPVEIKGRLPEIFTLAQNYPNPFNAGTNISFSLPSAGYVQLSIYDLLGRKVTILIDSFLPAGSHLVTWNGRSGNGESMATGIYFYRLAAEGFDETKKMLLVK